MKNLVEINKKAYELVAREYLERKNVSLETNEFVVKKFVSFLKRRFVEGFKLSVLDIGVGSGLDLNIFDKEGFQTFGIDVSEEMINSAKKTSPNSVFYLGDFLKFGFNRKFSAIYAQAFIHLFSKQDVIMIFDKMFSLLEPNGLIHFSTTLHEVGREGLEEKKDYKIKVKRYRKRWVLNELNEFLGNLSNLKIIFQYTIKDPFGKLWVNTILSTK